MTGSPVIEQRKGGRRAASLALLAALAAMNATPLAAQAGGGSSQLNAALRQLAARPGDLAALLSAGEASLALNDVAAAAGFYARAAAVAPTDRRVLLGSAQVALAQRRPLDALKAFAAADAAGVPALEIASDRGLAYDLVGDTASAQELYHTALAARDDAAIRRRLALSLAIAGDRNAFERALSPLLHNDDRAAFRTRAFGLAILGLTDEAVGIADAMMPTDLALRMAPYLRYMPRLTKAQQAAAANLGAFPAAADIGRDAPEIAAYASAGARIAARGDTSLTPSGAPLGTAAAGTARPDAKSSRPRKSEPVRVAAAPPRPAPTPAPTLAPTSKPAPALARTTELPAVAAATPRPVVVAVQSPPPAASQPAPPPAAARQAPPAEPLPSVSEAFAEFGAPTGARGPAAPDAVDVARLAADRASREAKAAADAKAAKAKADKLAAAKAAKDKADAAAKAKAEALAKEKAAKAEPARLWLQVGVGRNVPAFALDWKKLAKQADGALDGKGPWAIKYGATNRMLAGPYPTQAAQRAALKRLKDKGVDALPVSSEEGEKVTKAG